MTGRVLCLFSLERLVEGSLPLAVLSLSSLLLFLIPLDFLIACRLFSFSKELMESCRYLSLFSEKILAVHYFSFFLEASGFAAYFF